MDSNQPSNGGERSQGDQQIEQQISILKNKLIIPKRRNPKSKGSLGRATEVEVNHLPLNLEKLVKKTIYHIVLQFYPELPTKILRTVVKEFNRKHYPNNNFAFDGQRNMYSTIELKKKSDTITIFNEENNKAVDCYVTASVVNIIHMNTIEKYLRNTSSNTLPEDAFQALYVILKKEPFSSKFTNIGRSFFPVPRLIPVDFGEGKEVCKEFFQSCVMGWKPYLNVNVCYKGFPKHHSLTEYIKNEMRCDLRSEMDNTSLDSLRIYIKGLKVDYLVPNESNPKRSYRVVDLCDTAANLFFEEAGRKITIVQHYKQVRNYNIKYPHLPCLQVGKIDKNMFIPIELCSIQNKRLNLKKLFENQVAVMEKNVNDPSERKQIIENFLRDINCNQNPVLKEFGIQVTEQFACIPARVLDQPVLAYAQNRETKPIAGVWKPDRIFKPAQLNNWALLNLDHRTNFQSIKNFEKILLAESGKKLNFAVGPMNLVISDFIEKGTHPNEIKQRITAHFEQQKDLVDLIIVIIPDFLPGIYAAVKQISELKIGILTQCIRSKTMYQMNIGTAKNILLKINAKLNGINHTLADKTRPSSMEGAIIFGASVSHPSPDKKNIPSVAAVVASHDFHGNQYNMEWCLQSYREEIIQDLENIVHKQLIKYKINTNKMPNKIFYFRNGVGESQFSQLLEHELIAIRRACLRLNVNYKPPVTLLIVQKRHHTRIFPKHNIDMAGRSNNVPSGTIIDTEITHPTELEFILCSHVSNEGVSRPTKYHLLWDENNLTEDQLEQLTFYLCFMLARCTRSVSYPAPTYYAHLAAFRARVYIENNQINFNSLDKEQSKYALNELFATNTPMFFI